MWDLIVSVPDHCLSFYLTIVLTSFFFVKIRYECGQVVKALDSRSDVRVFKPLHRRSFFSVPDIFF